MHTDQTEIGVVDHVLHVLYRAQAMALFELLAHLQTCHGRALLRRPSPRALTGPCYQERGTTSLTGSESRVGPYSPTALWR